MKKIINMKITLNFIHFYKSNGDKEYFMFVQRTLNCSFCFESSLKLLFSLLSKVQQCNSPVGKEDSAMFLLMA